MKRLIALLGIVSGCAEPDWRRKPFDMCDGGSDYFGVETDLTASAVLHIAFDGCMCHVVPANQ